ncbi:predicted protein [Phaeodactylum tricornutum CCAP 1055/1]|uniref:FAD/NAD(P)-binding domain-containing protein n=1 Tax=Phaeodactylum tricornutum (strain CCAP 1055/1) TaxID=556484 RepID=B7FWV0_PHATC|nr:predicted protein [Phaeodactylum tricornutum CCAP 1055/1]EEC49266.1 predicted protein [Phaeodactylum tricornutum CCAP 1055/1]|eukprot:XP_002179443.1 predicted protein [Phaeodactylum tricornutum CCAP 1055/1]
MRAQGFWNSFIPWRKLTGAGSVAVGQVCCGDKFHAFLNDNKQKVQRSKTLQCSYGQYSEYILQSLLRLQTFEILPVARTLLESTRDEAHFKRNNRQIVKDTAKVYDFVIIGHGNCGRSALETLRRKCPSATVALVDPLRPLATAGADYYPCRVTALDPRSQAVQLETTDDVRYRHAVLLATGAHGAPIPHYLMDSKATSRVLEVRPSVLPSSDQRPIISPELVRKSVQQTAANGLRIGVLGSGWDAIDLVLVASNHGKTRPTIAFGNPGPASHMLPSYLSSAVARRLRTKKIEVLDRTLVRYISCEEENAELQIYTAKSYDFLDSFRTTVDLVVVAPEISGARGSAVLPTNNIPSHLESSRKGRSWYETWFNQAMSSVTDRGTVVCYKDDGRVSVNTELVVCSGVYAAGSVAKYANGLTGHADVAGVGIEDARSAGKVAAMNMGRQYRASSLLGSMKRDEELAVAHTKDPLPVWRSDLRSYAGNGSDRTSCLSEIGISCLAVGHCDSDRFATHAVWWTNQAAQRRLLRSLNEDLNEQLVHELKTAVLTNGGFGSLENELDQVRMSKYLESTSRRLVAIAFGGNTTAAPGRLLEGALDDFPRPLHRFTEVRPPSVRSHGLLKRKDGHGQGVLGEDLFARYQEPVADALPAQPIAGVGYASTQGTSGNRKSYAAAHEMYEWALWEQKEKRWDENEDVARPPKEDAIWIRKGDEQKNVAFKDTVAAAYSAAIWR